MISSLSLSGRRTLVLTSSVLLSLLTASLSVSQTDPGVPIPISFSSEGHSVKGLFYSGDTRGSSYTVILSRGFPGSEGDVLGLGQSLSNAGMNALTFNYSGTFGSEGVQSLESSLKDLQAAIEFLRQPEMVQKYQIDTTRIVLVGYCYGGSMVLNYAVRHPEIRRVVALVLTEHGEFVREYLRNKQLAVMLDSTFDALRRPNGPVNFGGREELKKFAQNPAPYDMVLNAPKIADRDILLVTGWDDFVTMTEAHHLPLYRALKKAGASHVTFVAFQTDHAFRNVRDQLAAELVRWLQSK
jgi:pimeloyl-ACP methyl ester carboxylesterase